MMRSLFRIVAVVVLAGLTVTAQQGPTPQPASSKPSLTAAAVGVSAERFQRLHNVMRGFVDRREVSGIVTLVTREGRTADFHAVGFQDVESKTHIRPDTIFRIAYMTKPITIVAIMML